MGGKSSSVENRIESLEKRLKNVEVNDSTSAKPKYTDNQWRNMDGDFTWSREFEERLKNKVAEHVTDDIVKSPRILLIGPAYSGKSSFMNAVATIDLGRISEVAKAGRSDDCMTTKLNIYRPRKTFNNFRILDTMGIMENEGFNIEDIIPLIEGKLPQNYKFNTRSGADEKDCKKNVKEKDKVHCVVIVVSAEVVAKENLTDQMQRKIAYIKSKVNKSEIPVIVILTKIDELCSEVESDTSKVFNSSKVEEAVKMAREIFKVPIKNIHPVRNYFEEVRSDFKINILILLALKQMMEFSTDYLNQVNQKDSSDDEGDN